jgi:hypothetical protein
MDYPKNPPSWRREFSLFKRAGKAPKQCLDVAGIFDRAPLQWARDLVKEIEHGPADGCAPLAQPSDSDAVIERCLYDPSPDTAGRIVILDRAGANYIQAPLSVARSADKPPGRSTRLLASALFEGPAPSHTQTDGCRDAEKRRPDPDPA